MAVLQSARFFCRVIIRNRHLLLEMTRRDLFDRYAGQVLGGWWTFIHTGLLVGVYTLLFAGFLYPNLKAGTVLSASPTMFLLSGIMMWVGAAEVFIRSPGIIRDHAELSRQVVFPTEVLPVKITLSAMFTMSFGMTLIAAFGVVSGQTPLFALPLLVLATVLLTVFLIGVSLLFSALGIFLKDVRELMALYGRLGVYFAPIFYFKEWVPKSFVPLFYLNPITWYVETFQDALAFGGVRSPAVWIGAAVIAGVSCLLGATVFTRLKPQFGSFV